MGFKEFIMVKRSSWFLILSSLFLAIAFASCATTPNPEDIAKQKKQAEAFRNLGESFMADDKYTRALKEFLKAEALYGEDHILQNDLGLVYAAMDQTDLSIVHYRKAIDIKPNYSVAWNNMGVVYLSLEQWDDAIECFNSALENLLYATPYYALNNLGEAYRGKGDYARAIDLYKETILTEPRFHQAYRGLGLSYIALGDYDAAAKSLEKAVKKAPGFTIAYYDLGRAYVFQYEKKKALAAFKKVTELAPDSELADLASREIKKLEFMRE
jgi:tetratricopeptide (TPR) repeat protein